MSVNAAMLLTRRGVNRTAGARARDVRQGAKRRGVVGAGSAGQFSSMYWQRLKCHVLLSSLAADSEHRLSLGQRSGPRRASHSLLLHCLLSSDEALVDDMGINVHPQVLPPSPPCPFSSPHLHADLHCDVLDARGLTHHCARLHCRHAVRQGAAAGHQPRLGQLPLPPETHVVRRPSAARRSRAAAAAAGRCSGHVFGECVAQPPPNVSAAAVILYCQAAAAAPALPLPQLEAQQLHRNNRGLDLHASNVLFWPHRQRNAAHPAPAPRGGSGGWCGAVVEHQVPLPQRAPVSCGCVTPIAQLLA